MVRWAMTWRPILEGESKQRALDVIKDVCDTLRNHTDEEYERGNLAGGGCGRAIMYAYVAQAGLGTFEPAEELLGRAVDAVAETPMRPDLYAGFTGVAWTAEHLQGAAEGDEDPNEAIDEALLEHVSISPWKADYDLIIGLVGFGQYALERVQRASARRILEDVVNRLHETAVPMGDGKGVSWLTSPELMIPETAKENPEGYYNAGLAHGVPGVIALLGQIVENNVAVEKARPLLEGAVQWMLSIQRKAPDGSEWPFALPKHLLGQPEHHMGCRAAWCYGDPGIAIALLWAARCAKNPEWEKEALRVAKDGLLRAPETVGCIDAGLCHGTMGLAHIYNRFYQATRDTAFLEAARMWYDRTLAKRKPGEGLCGYQSWMPQGPEMKLSWGEDPGLLTGVTGLAMGFLAGVTDLEPKWDRMLLTTVPPID
jgi:lantibiotic modifying enzyme